MKTRKFTDEQLQAFADATALNIMEDAACIGREEVDHVAWAIATADVENIHEADREVFFHMLGVTADDLAVRCEIHLALLGAHKCNRKAETTRYVEDDELDDGGWIADLCECCADTFDLHCGVDTMN